MLVCVCPHAQARCFGGLCGSSSAHRADAFLAEERAQRELSSSAAQTPAQAPQETTRSSGTKARRSKRQTPRDLATTSSANSCGSGSNVEPVSWDQLSENGAHPSRPLLVSAANPCLVYRPSRAFSHCKAFGA